jgi:cell division protein FtsZ
MAINFKPPEARELRPRITVLGVGGAGGNAVNNMIASKLEGVDFVVANTDAQSLAQSKAERRIQLGAQVTEGLGAGAQPDVGRAGAEETLDEIMEHLSESHMVFITAGMGGGTGTGAAPVIARAVREMGILTVGVVTKPFAFEGDRRMRLAEKGITELQQFVHTLIVIPNQNLFRIASDRTTFAQAFAMADDVLHAGVRGVTDLIVQPGMINLDFADIRSVIAEMGKAMMGTGEAEGEERAVKAADLAISNPLLDDVSMKGARGVLINITGGPDLTLFEVEQAANRVRAEVDPDANIIFGNTILEDMEGRVRVSVVATGIDAQQMKMPDNVEPFRLKPAARKVVEPPKPEPQYRPAVTARASAPVYAPAAPVAAPAAAMPLNPVRRQVEAIADEMGAATAEHQSVEQSILGGTPRRVIGEDDIPPMPGTMQPALQSEPMHANLPQTEAEPERRGWGFLGRRKPREELRREPIQPSRQAPQPTPQSVQRAEAQPMRVDYGRQASQGQNSQGLVQTDDLFPENTRDEQFEIPAFLRRQTN